MFDGFVIHLDFNQEINCVPSWFRVKLCQWTQNWFQNTCLAYVNTPIPPPLFSENLKIIPGSLVWKGRCCWIWIGGITLSINVHFKIIGCFMPQRQARQHNYYGVDFSILCFTTKLMSLIFFWQLLNIPLRAALCYWKYFIEIVGAYLSIFINFGICLHLYKLTLW